MKSIKLFVKKHRIVLIVAAILLIAAIVLSITLPIVLKKPNTDYDIVKKTKMDNFTFLNDTAEHNQVVLIGDSITEIFNTTDLFAPYTRSTGKLVYNRGISGDTSDKMLERLNDNALKIFPSHIVILIGTNDIGKGIANEVIERNVTQMIAQIKEKCPETRIILQAVYPVNSSMSAAAKAMVGSRKNSVISDLNKRLLSLAEMEHLVWLDLTKELSDENGNLNANYTYDGLHPNAVGFKVVSDKLIPLLTCDNS